jgi:hypothetical protein
MSLFFCPYICQPIFKGDVVVLIIEYELLLAGGPSPKKTQEDEMVGAQSEKSVEPGRPPSSLDDRLATLKRLKDQNLISEEDYQRKKQALLDQL